MRGTWGETRERQTTDSFGNFEDIFSEPVAPATGEADWLIGDCLRDFRGKHSHTRKKAEDVIYILPTGFFKSVFSRCLLSFKMHEDEFTFLLIVLPFTSIIDRFKSAAFHPRN